jgi:DNA-binding NarL/FixJ family response regulator
MPQSLGPKQHSLEGADHGGPDSAFALLNAAQWVFLQKRYQLTPRERQVAELVCRGLTNAGIARHLRIRPETVKTHVRNIYRRIGVRSKVLMLLRFVREARNASDRD